MEYKVGQAVIYKNGLYRIAGVNERGSITLYELLEDNLFTWCFEGELKWADQWDIFEYLKEFDWEINRKGFLMSPTKCIALEETKCCGWALCWAQSSWPDEGEDEDFAKDVIAYTKIVKALNLAK